MTVVPQAKIIFFTYIRTRFDRWLTRIFSSLWISQFPIIWKILDRLSIVWSFAKVLTSLAVFKGPSSLSILLTLWPFCCVLKRKGPGNFFFINTIQNNIIEQISFRFIIRLSMIELGLIEPSCNQPNSVARWLIVRNSFFHIRVNWYQIIIK